MKEASPDSTYLIIQTRWLGFLAVSPIICMALHLYLLSMVAIGICYLSHTFPITKSGRYFLARIPRLKIFLYAILPIAYLAEALISLLPTIATPYLPMREINLGMIPMIIVVGAVLIAQGLLFNDVFKRSDEKQD